MARVIKEAMTDLADRAVDGAIELTGRVSSNLFLRAMELGLGIAVWRSPGFRQETINGMIDNAAAYGIDSSGSLVLWFLSRRERAETRNAIKGGIETYKYYRGQ